MRYRRHSFLDPRIEIRGSSIEGRGMFALAAIPAGTPVIEWGGVLMTLKQVLAGKARPLSVIQVEDGRFLVDPAGSEAQPCEFMNHSCDSNLWMTGDVTLAARRDIAAGEELTCDYALFRNTHWIHDPDYKMACRCGSPLCRGLITGDDHRLPEVRAQYGRNLAPYLLAAPVLETVGA
jgi:SET domain-containing protein